MCNDLNVVALAERHELGLREVPILSISVHHTNRADGVCTGSFRSDLLLEYYRFRR